MTIFFRWTTLFANLGQNICLGGMLPTMPHDEVSETVKGVKDATKWFKCRAGHAYSIGDCGQPRQVGKCPCGEPIGGANYAFVDTGFNVQQQPQANVVEQTTDGYTLGPADQMVNQQIGVREINGFEVVVLRFILNSAMWLGSGRKDGNIRKIVSCQPLDPRQFFRDHIALNLRQIAQKLGKNEEYAQLLLHKILMMMATQSNPLKGTNEWATKDTLRKWEVDFAAKFIRPLVDKDVLQKSMDNLVNEFKKDLEGAESAILLVLEEEGDQGVADSLRLPQFWHPRTIINHQSLEVHLGGSKKMKEKCPSLQVLMSRQQILEEIRLLPRVLDLQRFIRTHFDGKIDANVAEKMSVRKFMDSQWPHEHKSEWMEVVAQYLHLIERTKSLVFEVGIWGPIAKKALKEPDTPIDMESSCTILFPNKYGFGAFAIGVVQLLAQQHNAICSGDHHSVMSLEVLEDESSLIVMSYEDVNLLIDANCSYELEVRGKGQQTKWELNTDDLEQAVFNQ